MFRKMHEDVRLLRFEAIEPTEDAETISIDVYQFDIRVHVQKEGRKTYFAEMEPLGAACMGGGKSREDAVMDFIENFKCLVDYSMEKSCLEQFLEDAFPSGVPEKKELAVTGADSPNMFPKWHWPEDVAANYAFAS